MRKKLDHKQTSIADVTAPFLLVSEIIKSDNNIPARSKTRMIHNFNALGVSYLVQLLTLDKKTLKGLYDFGEKHIGELEDTLARRGYQLGQLKDYQAELAFRKPFTNYDHSNPAHIAEMRRYGSERHAFPDIHDNGDKEKVVADIKALYPADFDFATRQQPLNVIEVQKVNPDSVTDVLLSTLKSSRSKTGKEYGLSGVEGLSASFVESVLVENPQIIEAFSKSFTRAANKAIKAKRETAATLEMD